MEHALERNALHLRLQLDSLKQPVCLKLEERHVAGIATEVFLRELLDRAVFDQCHQNRVDLGTVFGTFWKQRTVGFTRLELPHNLERTLGCLCLSEHNRRVRHGSIDLIGFGLPFTGITTPLENYFRDQFGITDFTTAWAVIALTLTYGAYVAEVYRAGIESIHPSQFAAARSLGLSFGQTMRFVIVPQAIRRIIPPLLNDFIGLQKDTALVNVIGAIDAFNQAKIIASNRFSLSPVAIVAFLFVIITIPQTRFVDRLLEKEQKRTSR